MPTSLKKIHQKEPRHFLAWYRWNFHFPSYCFVRCSCCCFEPPQCSDFDERHSNRESRSIVDGDGSPPREHGGFYHARNVACWHLSDMPVGLTMSVSRGNTGSRVSTPSGPVLTHLGSRLDLDQHVLLLDGVN